jgi:hypothetical protein
MTRLPRTSKLYCPVCREHYTREGIGNGHHYARGNLITHIQKAHGLTRDEAKQRLIEAGLMTEGCPLEQAIKDEAELKARGVL